jgi:hypothetical protein
MNQIFIIVWTGRDCISGIWAEYPCFDLGAYTSAERAQEIADKLNESEPRDYDADADDFPTYAIQTIKIKG